MALSDYEIKQLLDSVLKQQADITLSALRDAIKTDLQVMDDWDESDRAKVNLIVGQAGVAADAGAVGVTVPRMTLASNDPAVVDLAAIEVLDTAIKTAVELIDNAIFGNEMQVDVVASLPAGTNAIGKLSANSGVVIGAVSGVLKEVSVTKPLAAAGDYAAEDVLSESAGAGTAWTFAAIARANGAYGYITKAQAICETTALTPELTLFLFKSTPTSNLNDNVANTALLHADLANYVGKIDFPALSDIGGDSEVVATPSTDGNLPLAFQCAADADDLIGILVTRSAITGEVATDDMTIKLTCEQY